MLRVPLIDRLRGWGCGFPSPTAFEGMTFNLASWDDNGAVIHLQIAVLSSNSTCATAGHGQQLMTAGG